MVDERTIYSNRVFTGDILGVRVDTVALPGGGRAFREIVEHKESVVVVPITSDGDMILVSQYRKAPGIELLEMPAGGVEEGELPDDAVIRELREETGYSAQRIVYLGGFWTTPGFCTEYMHAYLAEGLQEGVATPEEDENIQVIQLPRANITELVNNGRMQDAKSLAALMMVVCLRGIDFG